MAKKTNALQSSTFRLPQVVKDYLTQKSTSLNTTQVDVLVRCVEAQMQSSTDVADLTKYVSGGHIKAHKIPTPNLEVANLLKSLGVGTACGVLGYHLSGIIREQYKFDEDKGTQVIIGLVFGILGFLGTNAILKGK